MRIWGLCKLPDGRDWLFRKLGLALVGRAMLNKSLTHFSAGGWTCAPSLLVIWPEEAQSLSLQSLWYDYRFYGTADGDLPQENLCQHSRQCPCPHIRPLLTLEFWCSHGKKISTHLSTPPTWLIKYLQGSSSYEILQARITHWSGYPFPSPEHLFDPGSNHDFLYCRQIFHHLSHLGCPNGHLVTLFTLHVFVFFTALFFSPFFPLWISNLIVLWSEKMPDMISIFLNLPRLGLWLKVWPVLQNVPCALEKKVYSSAFRRNVLLCPIYLV